MSNSQYARMTRPDLNRAIVGLAGATYPTDRVEYAVRAILSFNDLQTSALTHASFVSAVGTLAGLLDVAAPAVPADIAALTDAEAAALADELELAYWDFHRRANALQYTHQYWAKVVQAGGQAPTILQYRDLFFLIANGSRALRGLAPLAA